jgi:serine/threonine protein kinase
MSQKIGAPDRTKLYHFRIDQMLGRGGTGTVYRGIDVNTGAVVALKLFRANFFRNRLHIRDLAKSVQRFKKFNHQNVVRIYDFITGDEGEVLVQEYVDGPDLNWYMQNRPWNLQERLVVAAQICNGLHYIHEQGFIHHDLKPGNIMFTRKAVVKITDYSLVRQSLLTMFGGGLSEQVTPMFVAPELILKQKATPKSDIYSLGVTFYLLFTEQLPFQTDSLQRLYAMHLNAQPIEPMKINQNIPPALNDIIMRMMDKKPENRYENAEILRITLAEVGRSRI